MLYIYPSIYLEVHANMGKCELEVERFGLGNWALSSILAQNDLEETQLH